MLTIEIIVVDEKGRVHLMTKYKRHQRQGRNPEGYRYFEPSGWTIIVKPPDPDHQEEDQEEEA